MIRSILIVLTCIFAAGLLQGCSSLEVSSYTINGSTCTSVSKSQVSTMGCKFKSFKGSKAIAVIETMADQQVNIGYNITAASGALTISVLDHNKAVVWKETYTASDEGSIQFTSKQSGSYKLILASEEAQGSYKFSWNNEELTVSED